MNPAALAVAVAVVFAWAGAVVAISFMETPLKFRAPGITLKLGLGIGRVVFRAMNVLEGALALTLIIAVAVGSAAAGSAPVSTPATVVVAGIVAVLALLAQIVIVRPALARRTAAVLEDRAVGGSRTHLVYIGLEVIKLVALIVTGVAALAALAL